MDDLVAMRPTEQEIIVVAEWTKPLDLNPQWPVHVDAMATALRRRIHGA